MTDFQFCLPTKVFFGCGQVKHLGKEAAKFGSRVLLVYGGGSIKRNQIYSDVVRELNKYAITCAEFSGITGNPTLRRVKEGVRAVKEHRADLILAVGGGSVIDTAKAIAAGVHSSQGVWDMFLGRETVTRAVPVGVVLTHAATGSEANGCALITNSDTGRKCAIYADAIVPKFAIMDPSYTLSVNRRNTASAISDITGHVFEQYFSSGSTSVFTDHMCEAVLRTMMGLSQRLRADGSDLEARGEMMWAASVAGNGFLSLGKRPDRAVRTLGHELNAKCGVPYGESLSVLYPAWMKYVLDRDNGWKFKRLGAALWGELAPEDPEGVIDRLTDHYGKLGLPRSLSEAGAGNAPVDEMAANIVDEHGAIGSFKRLDFNDIVNIYRLAL